MVSSVFDAMEAVGVAGNGMNRLINRAGGATGPDDELVNTGPEDELVNTSPEDELVNRGGGAAATSTAEDWYGKGKGKGNSGEQGYVILSDCEDEYEHIAQSFLNVMHVTHSTIYLNFSSKPQASKVTR